MRSNGAETTFWLQPRFGSITVITNLMFGSDAAEAETRTGPAPSGLSFCLTCIGKVRLPT